MILLLRGIPLLVALLEVFLFWMQRQQPGLYPWIVVFAIGVLPVAALVLAWGRVKMFDLLEKMSPTFLLLIALAFGLLLAEGPWAVGLIFLLAGIASFMSLELLFLLAFHPAAYPVNGLSRINLAYVPVMIWYTVATSSGLMVFLHTDRLWHVFLPAILGVFVFRLTGHPGATREQHRVWSFLGLLLGVEVGLLGLLLPVGLEVQGLIAALLFTGVLRVRRYVHHPQPSSRVAWSEAIGMCILFVSTLLTAKWL